MTYVRILMAKNFVNLATWEARTVALMYRQSGLSQLLYSVQFIMFMVSGPPAARYKNLAVHLLPGSRISRSACCPVQESRGPPYRRFIGALTLIQ